MSTNRAPRIKTRLIHWGQELQARRLTTAHTMDTSALRDRISSTLTPDANIRRQAELDLKHAEENPGFVPALVEVLQAEQDNAVRQAAAVYLKNKIIHAWNPGDDYPQNKRIPDEQKESFRQRLPHLLAATPPNIRTQLIAALQTILHKDFPERWPGIFDVTVQLLNGQDAGSVYAGLQCILGICRVYRFKTGDDRSVFDKIVTMCFPQLLTMGNRLVQETSIEAGEMLRAIMKAFKHAIYYELPKYMRDREATVGWCTLFLRVVTKDPPPSSLVDDIDEREVNHWWKAKKWAYANLNRLFVRYGNPATLQKSNGEEYKEFSMNFLNNFAPEILKAYLQEVEKWVNKSTWQSKASLSQIITFLDECVKPKVMWNNLRPHTDNLVSHFIFPILCQSDEDLELFDSDPAEYLHKKLNFYEQVSAPDIAATNFLVTLTKNRKKETFNVLKFINGMVNQYEEAPADRRDPRQKEGALRMIGTLAGVVLGKKSPIADQVEQFFVRYVFPEFRSQHGFLRARACDTLEKFEALEFSDASNLMTAYNNVLQSLNDPELPVRVEAALALQPLIRHDPVRESMTSNIPEIMQQMLKLANEVDVDALANVMEDFVEVFSDQLAPYAVALTEQLRDTYLRIIGELMAKGHGDDDDDDGFPMLDDKSVTALGVLQTIGTLILTLESTPEVLVDLETALMPLITSTLDNKIYDLYTEIFEIVDSCTFASKSISPVMWQAFELMHKTFKSGAELYLEDMLPALENFVQFGAEHLAQNPTYIEAVVDMIRDIFVDKKTGGVDKICGCKLAEALMLNLRGHIDDYVGEFTRLAMKELTSQEPRVKSFKVHLIEMVINAVYYNPQLTLSVLEMNNLTNKFFSLWFANIDNFSRVHDKKLSIVAITALLVIPPQQVPASVQQGWPRLLHGLSKLFQTLPQALKSKQSLARLRTKTNIVPQTEKRPRKKTKNSSSTTTTLTKKPSGAMKRTGRTRPRSQKMSKTRALPTWTSSTKRRRS